jgi:hypothetical protein
MTDRYTKNIIIITIIISVFQMDGRYTNNKLIIITIIISVFQMAGRYTNDKLIIINIIN